MYRWWKFFKLRGSYRAAPGQFLGPLLFPPARLDISSGRVAVFIKRKNMETHIGNHRATDSCEEYSV